ncbi:MAG: hypothetical protein U0270_41855 [Labilithrix sp.]
MGLHELGGERLHLEGHVTNAVVVEVVALVVAEVIAAGVEAERVAAAVDGEERRVLAEVVLAQRTPFSELCRRIPRSLSAKRLPSKTTGASGVRGVLSR